MALLIVLASLQANYVWTGYAREMLAHVRDYGIYKTVERSEILVVGANDARFLRFLDSYLPPDAQIVGTPVRAFNSQNRMQFFLLPRPILACCTDQMQAGCNSCITDPDTYVMAIGGFPPMEQIPGKVFVAYPSAIRDLRGVFVPEKMAGVLQVPAADDFETAPARSPRYLFLDLIFYALLLLLGATVLTLILPQPGWLNLVSLSLPLSFGLLTWFVFISSYLGLPITRITVSAIFLSLLAIMFFLNRLWNGVWFSIPPLDLQNAFKGLRHGWLAVVLSIFLLGLFVLACQIAIGRSFSAFDEIANWGLKGYAMVEMGSIQAGAKWGGHVLSYPLNIPLSIGIFRLIDGDVLPGSKLIFPILAASLFLQIYRFLRRRGVDATTILAAGLLIFTVPDLFIHSTLAYANLPLTAYLVPAVLWTLDGLLEDRWRWVLLGGVLFAFAAWTRPEGIGIALLLLLLIHVLVSIFRREMPKLRFLAISVTPFVLPLAWMVLVGSRFMGGDQIGSALSLALGGASTGGLHLSALKEILAFGTGYFLSSRAGAGFLLPAAMLLLTCGLVFFNRRANQALPILFAVALLAGLFPAGLFFVASAREKDFLAFLDQSFNRAYFPAMILLITAALLSFAKLQEPQESQSVGADSEAVREK